MGVVVVTVVVAVVRELVVADRSIVTGRVAVVTRHRLLWTSGVILADATRAYTP